MKNRSIRRHLTSHLVSELLDDPSLPERIQELQARELADLVRHVGLEDAGPLVAWAAPSQLTELFDADLWSSARPGVDERFDPGRFAIWLEVLVESGEAQAAEQLAQQSEDFLAYALSELVLVLEHAFVQGELENDEEADKRLESQLCEELGDYLVVAKLHEGWDALLSILLAWDRDRQDLLERLLTRLAHAAEAEVEELGGLSEALSALEELESDAAAEREERRGAQGFVAPSSALAFLRLARRGAPEQPEEDAISRAYFRALDRPRARPNVSPGAQGEPLSHLLAAALESEQGERATAALPAAAAPSTARKEPQDGVLRSVLRALARVDPQAHARALEELAFLTNVLVSGDDSREQAWRPEEALEQVVAILERGLTLAGAKLEERPEPAEVSSFDASPPRSDAHFVRSAHPGRAVELTDAGKTMELRAVERWGLVGLFRLGYARRA